MSGSFECAVLGALYARDGSAPERVLRDAYRAALASASGIWIHRVPLEEMLSSLAQAEARRAAGESLLLFGVPFAVKDNIDVAGAPTTAACPAFAYIPAQSAPVVELLVRAGAILVGKTNLDQFATGLVGARSPYGIPENPFDSRYITGGSSSGSAAAVARGQVSFALGTDTAGSGRVPAALNHIVGAKPTRGLLSTRGVVPACRSLDCVSILANSAADAALVLDVCARFDAGDPFSRDASSERTPRFQAPMRIGVPTASDLEFFGDGEAARLHAGSVGALERLGAVRVEIDFTPFRLAAELLYEGPWVAERLAAAGPLLGRDPDAIHPVVRGILERARSKSALEAFAGAYRLAELRRAADAEWSKMDVLVVPTTPTTYTIADVARDPVRLNSRLGTYTNFVNLLDLAAVAVPSGFRADGLPLGVTLIGPAFSDAALLALAGRLHAALEPTFGAARTPLGAPPPDVRPPTGDILLAVAGAHLVGQPLHHQLVERRALLVRAGKTSPEYRLYALSGTKPAKPGLVFDPAFRGAGIDIEVFSLDPGAFGTFVEGVPPPLAIGTVVLEDGTSVKGFVCEPRGLEGATEITHHGGWRQYRESLQGRT